jgi:hypothetical protein
MSHALADVVLVEQFRLFAGPDGYPVLGCPACDDRPVGEFYTLGELLTAARRHISDEHPGGDPLDHEHAYTAVLHAVDATAGDPYPALIPELLMEIERPGRAAPNRCQQCGRTVRGPLLPLYKADAPLRFVGPGCLRAHRQNVSHVADPLPMPPAEEGVDRV